MAIILSLDRAPDPWMNARSRQQDATARTALADMARRLAHLSPTESVRELRTCVDCLGRLVAQIEDVQGWWERYHAYMQSDAWQRVRERKLAQVARRQKRAQAQCERCRKREATHVHHLTYERFGHERLSDLQALCPPCHDALH